MFTVCFIFTILTCSSADSILSWLGWSSQNEAVDKKLSEKSKWLDWIPFSTIFSSSEPPPVDDRSVLRVCVEYLVNSCGTFYQTLTSSILYMTQCIYSLVWLILGTVMSALIWVWQLMVTKSLNFLYICFILAVIIAMVVVWYSLCKKGNLNSKVIGALSCIPSRDKKRKRVRKTAWYISLLKGVGLIVVVAIIVSIPWEFFRLYQKEQAKKAAKIYAGLPPECDPQKLTILQTLKSGLLWHFSWVDHTPCEEYYHAVLVDPLWEVTPMMVLSSLFMRCFLHPLELASGSLGRSFKQFFSHIPIHWQPVIMVLMFVIFILLLVMACRYRLKLPLLFIFEPKTPVINHVQSRRHYIIKPSTSRRGRGSTSTESSIEDTVPETVVYDKKKRK